MVNEISDLLKKKTHPEVIEKIEDGGLQPALYIRPEYLIDACKVLRDTDGLYFDFLANLTAVDYLPEPYFEVVYHLTSIPYQRQLTLKIRVTADRVTGKLPEVPSVTAIWRTADWHEREAFDLMGIFFR